jgi:hypothetical protein
MISLGSTRRIASSTKRFPDFTTNTQKKSGRIWKEVQLYKHQSVHTTLYYFKHLPCTFFLFSCSYPFPLLLHFYIIHTVPFFTTIDASNVPRASKFQCRCGKGYKNGGLHLITCTYWLHYVYTILFFSSFKSITLLAVLLVAP